MKSGALLHKHRIVPGHMGGTYAPENVVLLTVREHAAAHKLLWEIHGHWQDRMAWLALSGTVDKETLIKTLLSEAGKRGGSKNKGKTATPETRLRLAKISAAREWTDEGRQNISAALMGHAVSEETRRKISASLTGRPTGRTLSEEQKMRMTLGKIGKPHPLSKETLQKRFGQKRSVEARARMKVAQQLAATKRKNTSTLKPEAA